ncbi:hypothetical protein BGZ65_000245, partial [Modicella reniformis]
QRYPGRYYYQQPRHGYPQDPAEHSLYVQQHQQQERDRELESDRKSIGPPLPSRPVDEAVSADAEISRGDEDPAVGVSDLQHGPIRRRHQ